MNSILSARMAFAGFVAGTFSGIALTAHADNLVQLEHDLNQVRGLYEDTCGGGYLTDSSIGEGYAGDPGRAAVTTALLKRLDPNLHEIDSEIGRYSNFIAAPYLQVSAYYQGQQQRRVQDSKEKYLYEREELETMQLHGGHPADLDAQRSKVRALRARLEQDQRSGRDPASIQAITDQQVEYSRQRLGHLRDIRERYQRVRDSVYTCQSRALASQRPLDAKDPDRGVFPDYHATPDGANKPQATAPAF